MKSMTTGALIRHLRGLGLGVSELALEFNLRAGHLPEPPRLQNGNRLWEPEDIGWVEAFFRQRPNGGKVGPAKACAELPRTPEQTRPERA